MSEVISGGQRGVDLAGERWARALGIAVTRYEADWERHGRSAGPRRNALMAIAGDGLLAFWDGASPGTRDMVAQMRRRSKPHRVVILGGRL